MSISCRAGPAFSIRHEFLAESAPLRRAREHLLGYIRYVADLKTPLSLVRGIRFCMDIFNAA
jgi:hypothetical protein